VLFGPARVPRVGRRHAESKQAMGFRRVMLRGGTTVRDGMGPRLRGLEPAPAAGAGRSGGLERGPPARGTRGP